MTTKTRYNDAAATHAAYWFVNDAERQNTLRILSGALWHGLSRAAADADATATEGCAKCHPGLKVTLRNPVTLDTICAEHDGVSTSVNAYRWADSGDTHSVGLWEMSAGGQQAAIWVHPSLTGSRCAIAFELKRDAMVSPFTLSVLYKALWTLELLGPSECGKSETATYDPDRPVVYRYDAAMDVLRMLIKATEQWTRALD